MEIVFKEPIQLKHLFSRHLKNDSFMNSPDNKLLAIVGYLILYFLL